MCRGGHAAAGFWETNARSLNDANLRSERFRHAAANGNCNGNRDADA